LDSPSEATSQKELVDKIYPHFRDYHPVQSALIPILQEVQAEVGYLPTSALTRVSELLELPLSHVYGVVTFYHQFRLRPKGRHMITICRGTACHVQGSLDLFNFINQELGMALPQDTSGDGLFTVQQVRCLGACGLAPVVKIDEMAYGRLDCAKMRRILRTFKGGGEAE